MPFYKDTPGNRKLNRVGVGYGKDAGKTQGGGGAPSPKPAAKPPTKVVGGIKFKKGVPPKPSPKPTGSFYQNTFQNRRLGRVGVGYGADLGKTDPTVKGAKPIKIPKEKPKSIIIKEGIPTKKSEKITNLQDFDKQKKKIVKKDIETLALAKERKKQILKEIEEHNDYEEELIEEINDLFQYAVKLEDKIDAGEGKEQSPSQNEGVTIEQELENLLIGKNSVLADNQDDLNRWNQTSFTLDKQLKKIEQDIENLSKLIEGKVSRNKDNKILKDTIRKEQNEIKKMEKEIEQLIKKGKNKDINVGKLNTIVNEIQFLNRAIERKTKTFKLAKPRPIGTVARPTIKSATASIEFNQPQDPKLVKALKKLEVLMNKPKSIIVQTLIREQQFIINRLREIMRIRGLMVRR